MQEFRKFGFFKCKMSQNKGMSESLIRRIRNRDQRALGELYQRYVGRLTSVCRRYVPQEADAKDVLQESFVKIFTALPTFEWRDEPSFEGWMVRIVVNESLRLLRNQHRLTFVEIDDAQDQLPDEDPDAELLSPDELHHLVSALPDGYRTVVNLYVFESYSHQQIAQLLGIRPGTSASQLHHAKRLLAKRIKHLTFDI